jgi:hypothetical protein
VFIYLFIFGVDFLVMIFSQLGNKKENLKLGIPQPFSYIPKAHKKKICQRIVFNLISVL